VLQKNACSDPGIPQPIFRKLPPTETLRSSHRQVKGSAESRDTKMALEIKEVQIDTSTVTGDKISAPRPKWRSEIEIPDPSTLLG